MRVRVVRLWEQLRSSYWFVPGLLAVAALALALGAARIDELVQAGRLPGWPDLYVTGAPGARTVLATIAGSAITVAGTVFSITIVVLSMASSQFGPRLLRNFMEQGGTQVVLGSFVGTFIYCVLVLAFVRGDGDHAFVPQWSVVTGIALGVLSFALLIYFIHHVTRFIQAPRVLDDVGRNLARAFERFFPARDGADGVDPDTDTGAGDDAPDPVQTRAREIERAGRTLLAPESGYVQAIDRAALIAIARRAGGQFALAVRAGQFAFEGHPVAAFAGPDGLDDDAAGEAVHAFLFGPERTAIQDPEYAVRQFVEVAVRALSPGINDPYTAISCIDRLGAALSLLDRRRLPSPVLRDEQGEGRVVERPITYAGLVGAAFHEIRQAARGHAAVTFRLLETLTILGRGGAAPALRRALLRQVEDVHALNHDCFAGSDRDDFEQRCDSARAVLGAAD